MPVSRAAYLPTKRSLYTVIRGPFAHKKSQENFEKVVHKRAIKVWDTDSEVLGKWIKYLEINLLGGVGMRIVRWERTTIGFGREHLSHVENELQSEAELAAENAARIMEVADDIIRAEMEAAALAEANAEQEPDEDDENNVDQNSDRNPNVDQPPPSTSQLSPDSEFPESSNVATAAEADVRSEENPTVVEEADLKPNDKS
jgi:hypothetical protein